MKGSCHVIFKFQYWREVGAVVLLVQDSTKNEHAISVNDSIWHYGTSSLMAIRKSHS